jgi:hypothetical protein
MSFGGFSANRCHRASRSAIACVPSRPGACGGGPAGGIGVERVADYFALAQQAVPQLAARGVPPDQRTLPPGGGAAFVVHDSTVEADRATEPSPLWHPAPAGVAGL